MVFRATKYSPNNPSLTPKTNHQSSTINSICLVTGNPMEKDAAKEPKNPEPFSAINIYVATKNVPNKCSTTIHGGVKNTPPAPSNPVPSPATTPPSAAVPTNATPPNAPPLNSSPPATAVATSATSTIVCGHARARIDFAIGTRVRWENVSI
ncbi:uncharacterized protein Bfra_006162 [Botrytis fragariae]|uniref:Uncharacterized protein n=1 Tax=Botrytis fragariae TaxID=1964551 RepID=A0A8H6ASF8_9HELO|nr:uncharacterized protein Bfra_006162 [Botrytis fragariae]KAF5872799.1 hypothetical protein Bfra_006162 [Botrytis fragariae]